MFEPLFREALEMYALLNPNASPKEMCEAYDRLKTTDKSRVLSYIRDKMNMSKRTDKDGDVVVKNNSIR